MLWCFGTGTENAVMWTEETLPLSSVLTSELLTNDFWSELSGLCSVVITTLS